MNSNAKNYFLLGGARLIRAPLSIILISLLSNLIGPEGIGKWAMVGKNLMEKSSGCF